MMKTLQAALVVFGSLLTLWCGDVQAYDCGGLSPWSRGEVYGVGDIVTKDDKAWQCAEAHTSANNNRPNFKNSPWCELGPCDGSPTANVCSVSTPSPSPPPVTTGSPAPTTPYSMPIYGVWHCGNNFCDWSQPITPAEFDYANSWIIDRGDGRASVNVVVLSFLEPRQVLGMTPGDPTTGVPPYMEQWMVDYFKNQGIRVMMSIGGITYTDFWTEALATNAWQLGLNAAAIAFYFGVGMEIDYEEATNPDLVGLAAFVQAYRSVYPYDVASVNPTNSGSHHQVLTIDLAAGGRYLQDINRHATINWLDPNAPVLDYANAMVHRSSGDPSNWQEHIDGMSTYNPSIPGKSPSMFTGGLFVKGNNNNCLDFLSSEQYEHIEYVKATGMLGYMFWAAGIPSARKNYVATVPPNTCEDGMGIAATEFNIAGV